MVEILCVVYFEANCFLFLGDIKFAFVMNLRIFAFGSWRVFNWGSVSPNFMQFANILKRTYKESRKKSDLTFRLQSDHEKINVNVSGLLGIDHLDNVPLAGVSKLLHQRRKPLFSDCSNCRWIHLERFLNKKNIEKYLYDASYYTWLVHWDVRCEEKTW